MNPRIFGAFLVGAGLIGVGYFFAPNTTPTPQLDATLGVVAGNAPARSYIEVGDNDNDGIPDWKENFRDTKPVKVDLPTEPDLEYEAPDTLTGQLAISMLTSTVRSKAYGSLGQNQEQILENASLQIQEAATDELFTTKDIKLSSDNSIEALHDYGNKIAEIIMLAEIPEGSRGEIEIVQHAVYTENESILAELDPIIAGYTLMRKSMLVITVPSEMATEHLNLLNSYQAVLLDIEGMKDAFDDPLYTLVRMQRYYDDATALSQSLARLYEKLILDKGVTYQAGDVAHKLVKVE